MLGRNTADRETDLSQRKGNIHIPRYSSQRLSWLFLSVLLSISACTEAPPENSQQTRSTDTLRVVTLISPTTYYQTDYGPSGFEYELAMDFSKSIGLKLEIHAAKTITDLFKLLDSGQADIAAASLTGTAQRQEHYKFSPPYLETAEVVLYKSGSRRPRNIEGLRDKSILVRKRTSHAQTLSRLKKEHPWLSWTETNEAETFEILGMLDKGFIDFTVMDSHDYEINKAYFPQLTIAFRLNEPQPLVWMQLKDGNKTLAKKVDIFFDEIRKNGRLEELTERHFGHTTHIDRIGAFTFARNVERKFPEYEELIKQVAKEENIDWRLLAAISYQESHWNPTATSPTGVRGMMMLTQATAREMGVENRIDARQSLSGGTRYYHKIKRRIPSRIKDPDRSWFALAAYNVGMGHMEDARVLTQRQGGDPDKWLDVMQRLPLLQKPEVYSKLRHGYARGNEPVVYVQRIRHYYNVLAWEEKIKNTKPPPTQLARFVPEKLNKVNRLHAL